MIKRILSAIVLALIFIPLLLLGEVPFTLLIVLLGCFSTYELLHVRSTKKDFPILPYILSFLWVIYFIIYNAKQVDMAFVLDYRVLIAFILSFFLPLVLIADKNEYNIEDAFYLFATTLFIGISYHLILLIRSESLYFLIYLFLITIFTDTFAFITGSMVGRHKLLVSVSPKKTVEGFIGGVIMGVFASSIFYLEFINPEVPILSLLIMSTSLSMIGQLGDLVFSSIKRYYDVKDFSNLIPGHGGILDRLDSIIFVCLAAFLFYSMI